MSAASVFEIAVYNTGFPTACPVDSIKYKKCDTPIKTIPVNAADVYELSPNYKKIYYFWKGDMSTPMLNKFFLSESSYKKYLKENKEYIKATYGKLGHDFFVKIAEFNFTI